MNNHISIAANHGKYCGIDLKTGEFLFEVEVPGEDSEVLAYCAVMHAITKYSNPGCYVPYKRAYRAIHDGKGLTNEAKTAKGRAIAARAHDALCKLIEAKTFPRVSLGDAPHD